MIKVRRNGKEIFAAGGNGSLTFPSGTLIDTIEQNAGDVVLILAEPTPGVSSSYNVTTAERALIRHGHMIEAIKSYRERTGWGLKDSKDVIDRERTNMRRDGVFFPADNGRY